MTSFIETPVNSPWKIQAPPLPLAMHTCFMVWVCVPNVSTSSETLISMGFSTSPPMLMIHSSATAGSVVVRHSAGSLLSDSKNIWSVSETVVWS